MILVILFLYVALFIKAKPHQQQSSPSKRAFFSAAPSPVSRVQCSPEKMKTMKKRKNSTCSGTSFPGTGRREPWERRCLWDQHPKDGKTLVCDTRDRAITWEFCRDLHLTLVFSGLLRKICLKQGEVWREVF